jgi:hypothetical protein
MKYLKRFNEQEKSIEDWCEYFNIKHYTINKDGTVDVNYKVFINNIHLQDIPIQFGVVGDYFGCRNNELTSLKGSPISVYGGFNCQGNKLITLEYSPVSVSGDYDCSDNKLRSLKGCPNKMGGAFICSDNELKTLEDGPKEVNFYYSCSINKLITLEGAPEKFNGEFFCQHNPIYEVYELFGYLEKYKDSLDYKYLRGTNIVRGRFKKACEDAGVDFPDFIYGYKYIDL